MEGVSFSDELARCLGACEDLLELARTHRDPHVRHAVVGALVGPVAVARLLLEPARRPSPDVLPAACRLCRDFARRAADELGPLAGSLDLAGVLSALRELAAACDEVL
jgi:hypothetical protein